MREQLGLPIRIACIVCFVFARGVNSADENADVGKIRLNEILASNRTGLSDDDGDSSDWVELYNASAKALRLDGYRLTNDLDVPDKWQLPSHSVPGSGYYVVWMSGKDRTSLSPEAIALSAASIPFFTTLIESGAEWKFLLPDKEREQRTDGWTTLEFDDSHFATGQAGFGYGDEDDATEVPAGTTAVLLRHEFQLDSSFRTESLILQVNYDDGFVAYLNGVRVAAMNASEGVPNLESSSRGNHEAGVPERFDISAHADQLRDGKNVLAVAGLNGGAVSSDMSIDASLGTLPPVSHASFRLKKDGGNLYLISPSGEVVDQIEYGKQRSDQTLGRSNSQPSKWGYFLTPTPGKANSWPLQKQPVKSRISFSPKPGITDAGVEVAMIDSSSVPVDVRFTLDGSTPTPSSPVYREPLDVEKSTVFRAAGFVGGERVSPVESATYLITHSKTSLPVLSISMNPTDFQDVHLQKAGRGRGGERAAFVEMFNASGKRVEATGLGIRLHGGAGRRGDIKVKKSYRTYFRRIYGDGRFDSAIIPNAGVKSFDKLVFRANFGDGREHGAYIRDQVIRDIHIDMGGQAAAGWWCVVYINSVNHGVFNVCERMDKEFFKSHLGPGDYDVIKTGETVLDGTRDDWDNLKQFIKSTEFSNQENFEKLAARVDIKDFTAYMIVNLWGQNFDWPHNNWYAARRKPDGKWIFLCWDAEWGFWGGPYRKLDDPYAFIDSGGAYGLSFGRSLFFALLGNADYREYYQQEVRRHLSGALAADNVLAHIGRHRDGIKADIEQEFDRRGYRKESWWNSINNVEQFSVERGQLFQKYTDEYFTREDSIEPDNRVAMIEDSKGQRHLFYRDSKSHLRRLMSSTEGVLIDEPVSEVAKSPPIAGRPSAYSVRQGEMCVIYRGKSGHLHELVRTVDDKGKEDWRHTDITSLLGIPSAGTDPTAVVYQGAPHIVFVDNAQRAREIWFDEEWRHQPLPAAPLPASAVVISKTSTLHVSYRSRFGTPVEQILTTEIDGHRTWSPRFIKRVPSKGQPIGFSTGGKRQILFRSADTWPVRQPFLFHHIVRDLKVDRPRNALLRSFDASEPFWRIQPIGNPASQVAGDPCIAFDAKRDLQFIAYRDVEGHIREASTEGGWPVTDPTSLAGAPLATGEPAGFVSSSGIRYYVYRGRDGHLHELSFDGTWSHVDLSAAVNRSK